MNVVKLSIYENDKDKEKKIIQLLKKDEMSFAFGVSPLQYAVMKLSFRLVRILIREYPHMVNENNVLYFAFEINCDKNIIFFLIENGADFNQPNLKANGQTPLMECVKHSKNEDVILYAYDTLKLTQQDDNGLTVLHHAIDSNNLQYIYLFVQECFYREIFIDIGLVYNSHMPEHWSIFKQLVRDYHGKDKANLSFITAGLDLIEIKTRNFVNCKKEDNFDYKLLPEVYNHKLLNILAKETGVGRAYIDPLLKCERSLALSKRYCYGYFFIEQIILWHKYFDPPTAENLLYYALEHCVGENKQNSKYVSKIIIHIFQKTNDKLKLLQYIIEHLFNNQYCNFKYNDTIVNIFIALIYLCRDKVTSLKCDLASLVKHLRVNYKSQDTIFHSVVCGNWYYYFLPQKEKCNEDFVAKCRVILDFWVSGYNINIKNCVNAFNESLLHYTVFKKKNLNLSKLLIVEFNIHCDIKSKRLLLWCKKCNVYCNNVSTFKDGYYCYCIETFFDEDTLRYLCNDSLNLKCLTANFINENKIKHEEGLLPTNLQCFLNYH